MNDYLSYVKNVPNSDVSEAGIDSITYEAAENLYTQTKFEQAANAFDGYTQKFPNGILLRMRITIAPTVSTKRKSTAKRLQVLNSN
ncbi:MAG: hypothetical protein IPP51_15975 [Bacteroidetes bacterium]|nr:hypothetical protein [Bacteroidota bacterium]